MAIRSFRLTRLRNGLEVVFYLPSFPSFSFFLSFFVQLYLLLYGRASILSHHRRRSMVNIPLEMDDTRHDPMSTRSPFICFFSTPQHGDISIGDKSGIVICVLVKLIESDE